MPNWITKGDWICLFPPMSMWMLTWDLNINKDVAPSVGMWQLCWLLLPHLCVVIVEIARMHAEGVVFHSLMLAPSDMFMPKYIQKRKSNALTVLSQQDFSSHPSWQSLFVQFHFHYRRHSFSDYLSFSPAHRGSGSRSLSGGPARMFLLAEGWRACLCGGRWWSMMIQRRQPRSTFAPASSGIWKLCPAARGTLGLPTTAAAWKWARWSSPAENISWLHAFI